MTELMVPVRVDVTGAQYRKLHALAVEHDVTVGSLVSGLVRRQLATKQRRGGLTGERERVLREMHQLHHSDADIAAALHVGQSSVQRWRTALGLPALRRRS